MAISESFPYCRLFWFSSNANPASARLQQPIYLNLKEKLKIPSTTVRKNFIILGIHMLCKKYVRCELKKRFQGATHASCILTRCLMMIFLINVSFEFCADFSICRLCFALKRQIIKTFYHRFCIFVVGFSLKNILLNVADFSVRVISSINSATTLI